MERKIYLWIEDRKGKSCCEWINRQDNDVCGLDYSRLFELVSKQNAEQIEFQIQPYL